MKQLPYIFNAQHPQNTAIETIKFYGQWLNFNDCSNFDIFKQFFKYRQRANNPYEKSNNLQSPIAKYPNILTLGSLLFNLNSMMAQLFLCQLLSLQFTGFLISYSQIICIRYKIMRFSVLALISVGLFDLVSSLQPPARVLQGYEETEETVQITEQYEQENDDQVLPEQSANKNVPDKKTSNSSKSKTTKTSTKKTTNKTTKNTGGNKDEKNKKTKSDSSENNGKGGISGFFNSLLNGKLNSNKQDKGPILSFFDGFMKLHDSFDKSMHRIFRDVFGAIDGIFGNTFKQLFSNLFGGSFGLDFCANLLSLCMKLITAGLDPTLCARLCQICIQLCTGIFTGAMSELEILFGQMQSAGQTFGDDMQQFMTKLTGSFKGLKDNGNVANDLQSLLSGLLNGSDDQQITIKFKQSISDAFDGVKKQLDIDGLGLSLDEGGEEEGFQENDDQVWFDQEEDGDAQDADAYGEDEGDADVGDAEGDEAEAETAQEDGDAENADEDQ